MNEILANMHRLMAELEALPPTPIFASCGLFSKTSAINFKDGDQEFVIAHADFWAQIPAKKEPPDIFAIKITDIDVDLATRAIVFAALGKLGSTFA